MKKGLLILSVMVMNTLLAISQPAILWQNSFGGTQVEGFAFGAAFSIAPAADGGCFAVGDSKSNDGDVTGHHGPLTTSDIWVVNLDSLGNIDWQISLGGSNEDKTGAVEATADGGCIVIGYTNSTDGDITDTLGANDAWVVKLDNTGTIQWQKSYGGSSFDAGIDIKQTPDGGYVFTAETSSIDGDITFNNGGFYDFWVVKTDAVGTIQWQNCYGGTEGDNPSAISLTNDGGYVLAGRTGSTDGDVIGNLDTVSAAFAKVQAWVVKLDSIGNIDWQTSYGAYTTAANPFAEADEANSVQQTSNGEYIVGGKTNSTLLPVVGNHGSFDYWLFKLSASGSVIWQSCLGGSGGEDGGDTKQTSDGGFISFGYSSSNNSNVTGNHGSNDYWLAKTDANAVFQWGQCYGGPGSEQYAAMCQRADGGFYLVGQSTSNSGQVSGHHGALNVPDMWVVRLSPYTVGLAENSSSLSQLQIFPNPVSSSANITFSLEMPESISIKIYDITGKEIESLYSGELSAGEHDVQWAVEQHIDKGIYLVKITGDEMVVTRKIIVIK